MQSGTIKWYDTARKYGFIVPDDGGQDVMFFASHASAAGFVTVYKQQRVMFEATGARVAVMFSPPLVAHEVYTRLVRRGIALSDAGYAYDAQLLRDAAAMLLQKNATVGE